MAAVEIVIPDPIVPRILTMARALYPQHAALGDAALFKRVTADYWRDLLGNYEGRMAGDILKLNTQTAFNTARNQAIIDAAGIG